MKHSDISIISLAAGAPTPLTDRWGDYLPRETLEAHCGFAGSVTQAYENLRGLQTESAA